MLSVRYWHGYWDALRGRYALASLPRVRELPSNALRASRLTGSITCPSRDLSLQPSIEEGEHGRFRVVIGERPELVQGRGLLRPCSGSILSAKKTVVATADMPGRAVVCQRIASNTASSSTPHSRSARVAAIGPCSKIGADRSTLEMGKSKFLGQGE